MNAPLHSRFLNAEPKPATRLSEIPYNYTSFSDREIVVRFLGEPLWNVLNELRGTLKSSCLANMLIKVLGDLWVVTRNPYLQDDLLENPKRRKALVEALRHRIAAIDEVREANDSSGNAKAFRLMALARQAVTKFENDFKNTANSRKKALDLSLNINALLLAKKTKALKAASLQRGTVSLESLDETVFRAMNDVDFSVADVLKEIVAGPMRIATQKSALSPA